ncbi:MAG: hypothetical protein Homavirus23_1, partial [Homavirus sp.]
MQRFLSNLPASIGKSSYLKKAVDANKSIQSIQSVNQPKSLIPQQSTNSNLMLRTMTPHISDLNVGHSFIPFISTNRYLLNLKLSADLKGGNIRPSVFVCALDISSSMGDSIGNNNQHASNEVSKYNRFDLVKHSLNTLIHCTRPEDRLALITFSHDANTILPLSYMDARGKGLALDTLNNIRIGGNTNLWSGIRDSVNVMKNVHDNDVNKFALTLTDGEPNVNPPKGIVNEFSSMLPLFKSSTMHTFGYSYGLDSELLYGVSKLGGGLFAHIPDYTMCNTVFINYISNCLTTAINKVDMEVQFKGCRVGNFISNRDTLGSINADQTRNVLLDVIIDNPQNFEMQFMFDHDGKRTSHTINRVVVVENDYEVAKYALMAIINKGLQSADLTTACSSLDDLLNMIRGSSISEMDKLITNIKSGNTNDGQIYKAFSSSEWFNRWGIHYLRYFLRSHELNLCSNFKDASLQTYGGPLFKDIRTEVEDIFANIPVPQPSLSSTPFQGNFQQSFYTPSGPCFDGRCTVIMENDDIKLIRDLKKGDKVCNSNGDVATILCIIKTTIQSGYTDLVILDDLRVTPWHPIKHNGVWVFPCKVKEPMKVYCDYVYNFVLDSHHIMTISGVDAITLGHGFTHDPTLVHPFFGTL